MPDYEATFAHPDGMIYDCSDEVAIEFKKYVKQRLIKHCLSDPELS